FGVRSRYNHSTLRNRHHTAPLPPPPKPSGVHSVHALALHPPGTAPQPLLAPLAFEKSVSEDIDIVAIDERFFAETPLLGEANFFEHPARASVEFEDVGVEFVETALVEGVADEEACRGGRVALAPRIGGDPVADFRVAPRLVDVRKRNGADRFAVGTDQQRDFRVVRALDPLAFLTRVRRGDRRYRPAHS